MATKKQITEIMATTLSPKRVNLILIILFSFFFSFAQNIIGYMPYWAGSASDIQYTKLTHINYSFAIPDVDGHLKPLQNTSKLQQIVTNAHAVGGKVLIAVGGWSENGVELDSRFEAIGANATYRTNLVNDIVTLVNQYNLDGADMDWEFPDAGVSADNFEALMTELYNALNPQGKLVTAAVSGSSWGGQGINTNVKNVVDWLNIMAYDFNNYQHSTYSDAIGAVQYYQNKGFPNSKLSLGVPFYARPSWESYASIVGRGADPYQDIFDGNGYNGSTTIKQKTNYVINNGLRGVMIWEISQDLTNQNSLVTAIDEEINANGNQLPTVTLTAPNNGATYTEGDNITLTANASDSDGSITKVEFFNGSTKLGEDISSPYSYSYSNVPAGSYDFKAIASDNSGGTTTSNSSTVTVNMDPTACNFANWKNKSWYNPGTYVVHNNHAWLCVNRNRAKEPGTNSDWSDQGECGGGSTNLNPTTSITSPNGGAQFDEGISITINANAVDSDGSINKVEFFANGSKLGEDLTSPYSYTWNGASVGTHNLTTIATDNENATGTSTSISITVNAVGGNQLPSVSITAPINNAVYTEGDNISINASASDADGTVSKVEFFANGTKLGEDLSSPYTYNWTNVSANSYNLTAVATDDQNATTTSSTIAITVNSQGGGTNCDGIESWSSKKWYNAGSQCVLNNHLWESTNRNRNNAPPSSNWNDLGECGVVIIPNQAPTTGISSPAGGSQYDEGNTISINATAADSDGSITKVEFFANGTKLGEDLTSPYSFAWNGAAIGTYSLTSVATDNEGASTTSASVSVTVNAVVNNQAPTTNITSPTEGSQYDEGNTITINAAAADSDGSITKVEFFANGTKLGEDLTSPYSYTWNGAAIGNYSLTSVAIDNEGASTTSASVSVTINAVVNNQAPTVNITSPADGAQFNEGTSITVDASASDVDGTVSKVEFFIDGSYYGEDLTSPYSINVSGLTVGSHTISAKSTDNENAQSLEVLINININAVGGGCSEPTYAEGNTYNTGDDIQNVNNLYDCTVGGWCSGAAWAYEPGVGMYWTEAWSLIRSCSQAPQQRMVKTTIANSEDKATLTLTTEEPQSINVNVFNTLGQLISNQTLYIINGDSKVEIDKANWEFGYYIIQIQGSTNTVQLKINK